MGVPLWKAWELARRLDRWCNEGVKPKAEPADEEPEQ